MTPQALTAALQRTAFPALAWASAFFFNRYTAFLLGYALYTAIISLMGGLGGVVAMTKHPALVLIPVDSESGLMLNKEYWELTLVFYLYCYGNLILRPSRWRPWLAALPLFLAYLGQDLYFIAYANVFRFAELAEIPELLKVLSVPVLVLLAALVAVPLGYYLWSINYRRSLVLIGGALPMIVLIAAVEYVPQHYTQLYDRIGQPIEIWSDTVSAQNNGRMMMLLYREAERRIAVEKTEVFRNRGDYDAQAAQLAAWIGEHGNKRNVHLVVLESFVDASLLKNANFSKDPLHPSFRKLFGKNLGFSLSPVFGGKTSQAEFEVLCGVPAFGELTGVEFNSFSGAAANCLPGTLEQAGYQAQASNAHNPSFFNTPNAYKGIGFSRMFFPSEYVGETETYLHKGDTSGEMGYMWDGEFFQQNLDFVAKQLQEPQHKPLFNYLLSIYGHIPHLINKEKRPLVVQMRSTFKDQFLEWAANQMYYRTQAVADYVTKLLELDPDSLIILVSDHLPPGQYGHTSYQKLRYIDGAENSVHMNRLMIIEAGKVKKLATVHHYDIPSIIINSLSNGAYCKEHSCGFAQNRLLDDRASRRDDYMRVMAHASE